jgi:hypothetical protein
MQDEPNNSDPHQNGKSEAAVIHKEPEDFTNYVPNPLHLLLL